MVIQELKPSQHYADRWLAVLEDGSILRVGSSQVLDFSLYAGKELSQEQAQQLMDSIQRSEWKEKAIALLTRKPQSRKELMRKLKEWGASPEESETLCDRMEELGFLNEEEYARQIVRHYSGKGFGEKKLRDELYRRGVPRHFWDEALEHAEDSAEALDAFLRKKLDGKALDRKELNKVSGALARRGYNWTEIRDALNRWGGEIEEFD